MYGRSWFWMIPLTLVWLVVLGAVAYVGMRLATSRAEAPDAPAGGGRHSGPG